MTLLSDRSHFSKSKRPRKPLHDDNGRSHSQGCFSTNFKRPRLKYVAPDSSKYSDNILGFHETGYMKVRSERPVVVPVNPSRMLGHTNYIKPKKLKNMEEEGGKIDFGSNGGNGSLHKQTDELVSQIGPLIGSKLQRAKNLSSQLPPNAMAIQRNSFKEISNTVDAKAIDHFTGKYFFPAKVALQNQVAISRNKVMAILRIFEQIYDEERKAKLRGRGKVSEQISKTATSIVKQQIKWTNRDEVGAVRGIEIGDRFRFKGQLVLVGLHYQYSSGISYITEGEKSLATSIVDSNRYANKATLHNDRDIISFSGHGGNPLVSRTTEVADQKLERGNLALKTSMDAATPVRVIRKLQVLVTSGKVPVFVYDGLYMVSKCRKERGPFGKMIFMFELTRIAGQPKLADCI